MIYRLWLCKSCRRVYEVGGSEEEIKNLLLEKTSYPCITPLCRGRLNRPSKEDLRELSKGYIPEEIPLKSFFRAVMGFGMTNGAPAAVASVKELLLSKKIVGVMADPVGNPERTILNELVFEDGTRLHFGLSSLGACCYYVEGTTPSCVEVFDREQSNMANHETATESVVENREEVGRAVE